MGTDQCGGSGAAVEYCVQLLFPRLTLHARIQSMNSKECFQDAGRATIAGSWIFYGVTAVSAVLLVFPGPALPPYLHPLLVVAAAASVVFTVIAAVLQTRGNRLLRESQLADALNSGLAARPQAGYYNNDLAPGVDRLAVTTLENTLFSAAIADRMLRTERLRNGIYLLILILLMVSRGTGTELLLLLAQTVFSADLILNWIRLEVFRARTAAVHQRLKDVFLQGGTAANNRLAILLAAFAEYECAKDTAAMPLDSKLFNVMNPELTAEWEQLKRQLSL